MEKEHQDPAQDSPQSADKNANEQPGWFQEFVDHYDVEKPQQGEMLSGVILDIQESSILLDVGLKRDAIIPGHDLDKVEKEIRESLAVGDEITVAVIRTPLGDDDLLVSLQRGLTQKTWAKAEELAKSDQVIELEVVEQNRGGLLVLYESLQAFVPNSHIPSIRRGTSTQKAGEIKAELIGKKIPVKVIEVNSKESRLVFSARVAQKEHRLKRLEEIEVGQVVKSRVVNVVDFGIFVDLEGVDGLVHKSEIDWERVSHPSKMFSVGDEIEVKVVSVDKEQERVSLSRKVLLPNPWEKLVEKFHVGDLVEGVVVSVLDFGAFVELQEGLHGLVHVSEIGYAATEDPKAVLKKDDPVLVKIMGIESARERISLSMRRVPVSEQMEWMMNLEEVAETAVLDSDQDPGSLEASEGVDLPAATEVDQLSGEDEPGTVQISEGEEITSEQEQVIDPEPEIEPEQEDLETSEGD